MQTAQTRELKEVVYEFGPYRLIPGECLLICGKEHIHIQPRWFQVLWVLVRNDGRLVTYESLTTTVWKDVCVQPNNLNNIISILNGIFRKREGKPYIENVSKNGYRFIPEVRTLEAIHSAALPVGFEQKSRDHRSLSTDVAIEPNLLGCLNNLQNWCKEQDVPFRIPNVLLALLTMSGGFAENAFNRVRSGFGSTLRARLRSFVTKTQIQTDRRMGRQYTEIAWSEQEYVQFGSDEAERDKCPLITEKYLMLGILRSSSSNTIKWLRKELGEKDFNMLIATIRDDHGTPIHEDYNF